MEAKQRVTYQLPSGVLLRIAEGEIKLYRGGNCIRLTADDVSKLALMGIVGKYALEEIKRCGQ